MKKVRLNVYVDYNPGLVQLYANKNITVMQTGDIILHSRKSGCFTFTMSWIYPTYR